MKNETRVEQKSEREIVITRTFNASARIVFEAWTTADLMRRWWVPKSSGLTLLSCEMDVRTGGSYRFVFKAVPEPMAFFGRYLEVSPHSRLVWTNDESGDAGQVSTLTLEEHGVVRHFHAGHGPGRYVLVGGGEREYLACDRCGAIAEVDRSELDPVRDRVQDRFGYEVGFTHFPMVGLCPRCTARQGGVSS